MPAAVFFWVSPAYADPFGGALSLDASGSYQGYGLTELDSATLDQSLRERLRATFEGYLFDKSIASWRVGASLDNQTIFGDDGSVDNRPSYQYDWRLSTWSDGVVPVRLYGSHQTNAPQVLTAPTDRVVSDVYGYGTSLNIDGLPKLDSSGYHQVVRSQVGWDVSEDRTTSLHAGLHQSSSNTVARATADWAVREDPEDGDRRDSRTVAGDANYRITDDVSVAAHATGREYRYLLDGDETTVASTESNAFVRWRRGKDASGMAYVQQARSALDGNVYSGLGAGTSLSRRFPYGFSADGDAGVTWDEVDEDGEAARYLGEFARLSASHAQSGPGGTTQLVATTGIANLTELDVGSGVQAGAGLRGSYGRNVAGFGRANVGALVSTQTDTSPLDNDFLSYGWNAALNTQRFLGLELGAAGSGVTLRQLSREDGDTDDLRLSGIASLRVAAFLKVRYTLSYDWLQMDEEYSQGLGHTVRADLRASGALTLSALGYNTRWATSTFEPTEWWRAEGLANFRIGKVNAQGRVYYDRYRVGDEPPSTATGVLVEVSRRFSWAF